MDSEGHGCEWFVVEGNVVVGRFVVVDDGHKLVLVDSVVGIGDSVVDRYSSVVGRYSSLVGRYFSVVGICDCEVDRRLVVDCIEVLVIKFDVRILSVV